MAILYLRSLLATLKQKEFWRLKKRRNNHRKVSASSTTTTPTSPPRTAPASIFASLSKTTTATQKRVSFSPLVQVHPSSAVAISSSSSSSWSQELDNNELWYSQAEINKCLQRDAKILFQMHRHSSEGGQHHEGTAFASVSCSDDDEDVNDNDECTRGLESKTIRGARRSKRTQTSARMAVLEEQQRQRQQQQQQQQHKLQPHKPISPIDSLDHVTAATTLVPTTIDHPSIKLARVYALFTRPNQELARQRALMDGQYVRDYVRDE